MLVSCSITIYLPYLVYTIVEINASAPTYEHRFLYKNEGRKQERRMKVVIICLLRVIV